MRFSIVKIAFAPHSGLSRGAALRRAAAAPFVGEEHLRAVVVERGRVPVGEVRVGHRIETHRVDRIADVEQQAVAFTRAAGQAECRVDRDVVALRTLADRATGRRTGAPRRTCD